MSREFAATPEQLFRAHTDRELFAQWIGPDGMDVTSRRVGRPQRRQLSLPRRPRRRVYGFHGSFHEVRPDRLVQTFSYDGEPDSVALETLTFTDLGNGRTRLEAQSLCDSFEARDAWLASGMEVGVEQGYAKLDRLLEGDAV